MAFELPPLPYERNALAPHISEETLNFHYGKHHNTYVVNLNYWHSMKPNGGGKPTGAIAEKIAADFGSYEKFAEEFKTAGATQFGSGWAWLVLDGGKLKVTKTGNAACPLTDGATPLLTMDVWEHAYYLDFQNRRPDYIATFLDHLVNWDFANENLAKD